jgi:hypothetical protein
VDDERLYSTGGVRAVELCLILLDQRKGSLKSSNPAERVNATLPSPTQDGGGGETEATSDEREGRSRVQCQ